LISDLELTNPVNCTTPLKVSTLISADFKDGSLNIAALTLVVMAVSSMYSPVLSWVRVAAQPKEKANIAARKKHEKRLVCNIVTSSVHVCHRRHCPKWSKLLLAKDILKESKTLESTICRATTI